MASRSSSRLRAAPPATLDSFERLRMFLSTHAHSLRRTPGFNEFYDGLAGEESDRVGRLWSIVECLQAGEDVSAAAEAASAIRAMPDADDGHGALAVRTFAEALLARVQKQSFGGGNLYVSARPPGAQLRAFELLRQRTPLIEFGYAAANCALLDALGSEAHDLTLLDVGIGRGAQLRGFIEAAGSRGLLRSLHVIGVDPDTAAGPASGALEIARETVLRAADEAGVHATFRGIPKLAEELTVDELLAPAPRAHASHPTTFLATCTFALHHVVAHSEMALSGRDAVLRTLRAAGVRRAVLVEPDSNHFDNDLGVRFVYAYRHYRTLSAVLATQLTHGDALVVWNEFFAPEVQNVIAHEGSRRVERHEELARWAERAVAAGWAVDNLTGLAPKTEAPPGFGVRTDACGARLSYRGVSLLGVLRARAS